MSRVQFRKDTAGPLEYYPQEGRPDSNASLTIYDGRTEWTGGTGALTWPATITLGTFSQNLTATGSPGDLSVGVTTSGMVRGQRYWLKNHRAQVEEIMCDGFDGSTAYFGDPIRYAQTTSSLLADHRLTYALTANDTAVRIRNLRAVWSYTVDSVDYQRQTFFDVVWQPFSIEVTEQDMQEFGPALTAHMTHEQLRGYISGGHRLLEDALKSHQIEPDLVRNPDDLRDALVQLVLALIAENQGVVGVDGRNRRFEAHDARYRQAFAAYLNSHAWYDSDDDLLKSNADPDGTGGVVYGTTSLPGSASNLDDYGLGLLDERPPATGYAKIG